MTVTQARALFPRGLIQPEGSFRFSADALLLAAFAVTRCLPEQAEARFLDLGCGCGVVSLACLLVCGSARAYGVEIMPELVGAAMRNASNLGLETRYTACQGDLETEDMPAALWQAPADVVLANMPYRRETSGRLPHSVMRRKALFAGERTVAAFMRAAARALKPGGSFALIYPWADRRFFAAALREHGFALHTLLPVRTGRRGKARCLARAVFAPLAGRAVCAEPLALREPGGYTPEALAFCPWLGTEKIPVCPLPAGQ